MDQQPPNEGDNPPPPDRELTPETTDQLTRSLADSRSTLTRDELPDRSIELELIRERRLMMEMMATMSQNMLELKRGRSETLDAANPNPTLPKRSSIFKPLPHTDSYTSTTYESYCKYIKKIKNQVELCKLSDLDTVNYAKSGLEYTEQNLWEDHCQQPDIEITWNEFQVWLLSRLGDSENRVRDAWRSFFHLRKRADESDFEWMNRFQEKLREIGPDNEKVEEFVRNIFLWQFDRPMRDKLDELAELPNELREITATATRLRPNVTATRSRETNQSKDSTREKDKDKDKKPFPRKNNPPKNPTPSTKENPAKDSKDKEPLLGKDPEALKKEGRCFNCGNYGHLAKDCPNKKE